MIYRSAQYGRINGEVDLCSMELRTESFSANKQIGYASGYAVSENQTMFNRVMSMLNANNFRSLCRWFRDRADEYLEKTKRNTFLSLSLSLLLFQ